MDNNQRGILILIKSAITGEVLTLPDDFSLEEAFVICHKRQLLPLLYTGAVRCGISKQDPLMMKMLQYYFKYMVRSEKQMTDLKKVLAAFDKHDIDYLPLKGSHLKSLYPKPELRLMGDADVLIRLDQYEKIKPIMKKLGFMEKVESDHELIWASDNLYLELHKRLIPSYNKDYYKYYGEGWQLTRPQSGTRYEFQSPEDEFVYLFTHFAKHYRNGGIGCRHVIDLWVFRRIYPDMNENYILEKFEELQLTEFYQNILKLIDVWFEGAELDEKSAFIGEFIFSSGNWGSAKVHALASSVQDIQSTGKSRFYRLRSIKRLVFPDLLTMQARYPILKKYPYLRIPFYPIRVVDTLVNRPYNARKYFRGLTHSTSENVKSHEQSLNYVGLKFNFKDKEQ